MNTTYPLVRWVVSHETLAWWALSAFALAILRTRTAEEWVALGQQFPRIQGLIRALRGIGVDPVKVVRGLTQALVGRAASCAPHTHPSEGAGEPPPPEAPPSTAPPSEAPPTNDPRREQRPSQP
jgi:hypothetical protein